MSERHEPDIHFSDPDHERLLDSFGSLTDTLVKIINDVCVEEGTAPYMNPSDIALMSVTIDPNDPSVLIISYWQETASYRRAARLVPRTTALRYEIREEDEQAYLINEKGKRYHITTLGFSIIDYLLGQYDVEVEGEDIEGSGYSDSGPDPRNN